MDERVLIETRTTIRSQVEVQSGTRRLGQLSGAQLCTCQFPFQCQTIGPENCSGGEVDRSASS